MNEDVLAQAALSLNWVRIAYTDEVGRQSQRWILPLQIQQGRNGLNLEAWCHMRQAYRTFKIKAIEVLQVERRIMPSDPPFDVLWERNLGFRKAFSTTASYKEMRQVWIK
jgi:predicted DNA-binding transcriptional regulator YafY